MHKFQCPKCSFAEFVASVFDGETLTCPECGHLSTPVETSVTRETHNVILTTTNHIEGCIVKQYLGIESVEFVIGTGVFSEFSSGVADFFGSRSTAFESKLQEAKNQAFETLRWIAFNKGANAVVGIDLDYAEFSGNRIALMLNGTLVKVAYKVDEGGNS